MALPPLVHYNTVDEYRRHYGSTYCGGLIKTFDGVRVYFSPGKFEHVFYESSTRDGVKDAFSPVRAQRIDWIRATLQHPEADLLKGWDKRRGRYDDTRRVAVVYEEFVVVVRFWIRRRDMSLKADFVTCYQADNSIDKIRSSPAWSRSDCLRRLEAAL